MVTTCCYIARLYGVRSAMPMFKARALCPSAVIIRPDMAKYVEVSRQIRALMENLTPLVQPLSIDEAVLDLSGTEALHGVPPAITINRLARQVERDIGVSISIGLSHNRLLAKLAAERGKPRGFSVFGAEAAARLAPESVSMLPGIGPAQAKRLQNLGITRIGQLAALDARTARQKLGDEGPSLAARARGEDMRIVHTERDTKSISAETTFDTDIATPEALEPILWQLCEKLGRRLREQEYSAIGIVLKLKTANFVSRTRSQRLNNPTQLPEILFEAAKIMLGRETDGTAFRLIGIGASPLGPPGLADLGDLADISTPRRVARAGRHRHPAPAFRQPNCHAWDCRPRWLDETHPAQRRIIHMDENFIADKTSYREAMSRLGAAVNIITTASGTEGDVGFTASAVCSVTDDPPTLLVCMNRASKSNPAFLASKILCVNVLAPEHQELSAPFASVGNLTMAERFGLAKWLRLATGSPVLEKLGGLLRLHDRPGHRSGYA